MVFGLFAKGSGWKRLADVYAYSGPFPEPALEKCTVQVGSVRYRRCMRVASRPEGLYLAQAGPGARSHPPLLIPWSALRGLRNMRIYWEEAHEFGVGDPQIATLAIPANLYRSLQAAARPPEGAP